MAVYTVNFTPSPRLPHCIQRRLPRSIPVGIRMEQRVHRRLQSRLHHLLCDPIRHGRYAQFPCPTVCFRYFHRPHRRWKVAARRHPIPDLVQVPFQVPFKVRNRLLIDPCRSLVRFYSFVRLPDLPLGNTERLCLTHRLLPLLVGSLNFGSITQPLRSIPLSRTSSLLRVVPSLVSASVLSPSWFFHLRLLRSHRSPRFPRSAQSPLTSSGHLNAGCRLGP